MVSLSRLVAFPFRRSVTSGALVAFALVSASLAAGTQPNDALREAVERTLRSDLDIDDVEVAVDGSEVLLSGRVETFWVKSEALRLAFQIPGVSTVATELVVPAVEDDRELARDVGRTIQQYPHYTVWDYVTAVVDGGVVVLGGRVTPDRDKAGELFERVAKLRGVQDVQNGITPLSPSQTDASLRRAIGARLFSHHLFARFGGMSSPPFRIIVESGVVTLVGFVQSEVERVNMELVVADIRGVRQVRNELQTLR